MKLRILSDLHLEANPLSLPDVSCDVVILAGDIAPVRYHDVPVWARKQFGDTPILWVMGNHEYYGWIHGGGMQACLDHARASARNHGVVVLEQESYVINDVHVLGCTLWTNFNLQDTPTESMLRARRGMGDFDGEIRLREASGESRFFRPQDSLEVHQRSVRWLEATLVNPRAAKTVVITHHPPHPRFQHSTSVRHPLSPAFCSDLGSLIETYEPVLWVSDHTHASHDFKIGSTRLVSNQRGYRDVPEHVDAPFNSRLVVDV